MTDETVKEPINAHKVAETERMKVMPALFGMRFAQVEQTVYQLMDRLCSTYQGGQWELYTLSNSSFYMAPRRADKLLIAWDGNGFTGEMSADAAGIVACLFTYSALSFQGCETCGDMYHLLLDYAEQHPEASLIFSAID